MLGVVRSLGFPVLLASALLAWGCASLKESRTAWPVKEYEKLVAGRLDADYVGTASCVEQCHAHDSITRDFRLSIHGEQTASGTGLPLVNCESCHGPGSLAVANVKDGKCDFSTFIPLEEIPPGARSLICLKCHSGRSLAGLAGWPGSRHAEADVSCLDCHKLHQGPGQKVDRAGIAALCIGCHQELGAAFSLPSHHPVLEGIMTCTDCHHPHGSTYDADMRHDPLRTLCADCHREKAGPFVFEHAALAGDCSQCHDAHGSANRALTRWNQPFLCLQCHGGHNGSRRPVLSRGDAAAKAAFFGDCTGCHSRIHGTDLPGYRNDDRFTR